MSITIDAVNQRLQNLNEQKNAALQKLELAKAQLHAVDGAIQDCEFWLTQVKAVPVNLETVPVPGCDMPVKTFESGTERSDGPDKKALQIPVPLPAIDPDDIPF